MKRLLSAFLLCALLLSLAGCGVKKGRAHRAAGADRDQRAGRECRGIERQLRLNYALGNNERLARRLRRTTRWTKTADITPVLEMPIAVLSVPIFTS